MVEGTHNQLAGDVRLQRDLMLDAARMRAGGNEMQAKELEGQVRRARAVELTQRRERVARLRESWRPKKGG
jgi:hypothetical protein